MLHGAKRILGLHGAERGRTWCAASPDRVEEELPFALHRLASDGLWQPVALLCRKFPLRVSPLCAQLFDAHEGGFWPFEDLSAEGELDILFNFYKGGVLKSIDINEIRKWTPATMRDTFKQSLLVNYDKWLRNQPTRCEIVRITIIKTLSKLGMPHEIVTFVLRHLQLI